MHVLRPDVHPGRHYISEYGNDAWSWLLAVAVVLTALGVLSLASILRDAVGARTAPRLMSASAAMLAIAALFSTDRQGGEVESRTLAGQVHGVTAIGAFCLLTLAMAMLSPRLEGDRQRLGRSSTLAVPLAAAGVAVVTVAFFVVPEAHGVRQRAFLAIVFGWLVATALRIRALPRPLSPPRPRTWRSLCR